MGILCCAFTQGTTIHRRGRDKMKTLIVLLAACFVFADGFRLTATMLNCGSRATVDMKAIEISDCAGARCILTRGQRANLTIPFTLPKGEDDACKYTGCPIERHNPATFKYSLFVQPAYPPLDVGVKWELVDQSGATQVCIIFPATLK